MCGIIGCINSNEAKENVELMLQRLRHRGHDASNIVQLNEESFFGHNLLALVGHVAQPVQKDNHTLVFNGEIYNWETLAEKHSITAQNDAELLFSLLQSKDNILSLLNELDGVFAFAYSDGKEVILARDKIGIKPLWYATSPFMFASEKKALLEVNATDIHELNPRTILAYDLKTKEITTDEQSFFSLDETTDDKKTIYAKTKDLLVKAVLKRVPDKTKKVGILFSGGIDSTVIAKILQDANIPFTCYTAGFQEGESKDPEDVEVAKKVAEDLDLPLKINMMNKEDVLTLLKELIPVIEEADVVKAGVALPFYASCQLAKEDGVQVLFSGLGSEEIFAGYERHRTTDRTINEECIVGLLAMHKRDLYRDDVVTMAHTIELRLPLLDRELVRYALSIPSQFKIVDNVEKAVLREISKELGVPSYICERKKRAAQYGSRFDQAIKKLAKNQNFQYKADFLEQFL